MSKESNTSGGVGFTGLLTVAFIVLKLCGVISWSWWWVLSPLWISVALCVLIVSLEILSKTKDEKKRNESGYHRNAWKNGGKSKWEQRLEEMKKKQKADVN